MCGTGGTEVAEGWCIGGLGSADTTVGTNSTGIGGYRTWHRAAHGKVQRICAGLRRDVERRRRDSFTSTVSVPKREMCAGVRRGRKVVLDRCAHGARWRDATDDIAADARMSLPVMRGHARHEHALDLVGGRGVGRGRHVHVGRVDRSARGGISSPVRRGELGVCDRVGALSKRRRSAVGPREVMYGAQPM